MNKFEKFFSIDEFKISALVVLLFLNTAATLIHLFVLGTIPSALVDIELGLIYSIAGVNAFNQISNSINRRTTLPTQVIPQTITQPNIQQVPQVTHSTEV